MAHPEQTGSNAGKSGINDDEAPLDPAVERVRRKLVRLLLWSFGIMILGLIAVFSTIVYRIYAPGPGGEAAVETVSRAPPAALSGGLLEADIDLPAGSQIVATSLDGPHLLIHLDVADPTAPGQARRQLIIVEIANGNVLRRFNLTVGGKGR